MYEIKGLTTLLEDVEEEEAEEEEEEEEEEEKEECVLEIEEAEDGCLTEM